jgi:hypothetical protein
MEMGPRQTNFESVDDLLHNILKFGSSKKNLYPLQRTVYGNTVCSETKSTSELCKRNAVFNLYRARVGI